MNIILFSTADWDNPFWTNKQHMAKTFEKHGHKVIYIDSLGIRQPKVDKRDFLRIVKRFKSLFKPYKQISPNLWIVSPFVVPFRQLSFVNKFNDTFLSIVIKILMFFFNFKKYTIWTYSPVTDTIIDKFEPSNIIYHCVDNLSALPNVDKELLIKRELKLINKSDYIFTTSQSLYNYIKPINKNTYYQNNVCDYEHFSKAKNGKLKLPDDLKTIKSPIIIFIGAISSYKVNFQLLSSIVRKHKNWNIVMIGQVGEGQPETDIELLTMHTNIHLLGAKDYSKLPTYLHFADVAIIPANINDYTKSMFPMKFFEYLSAGLQVVTTNLESLQEYKDIAYICEDQDSFEEALKDVIEKNSSCDSIKIDIECQKHTWDNRYSTMMEIIAK
jgi:glycosyltransferase involved in cell wall biosynthesis